MNEDIFDKKKFFFFPSNLEKETVKGASRLVHLGDEHRSKRFILNQPLNGPSGRQERKKSQKKRKNHFKQGKKGKQKK